MKRAFDIIVTGLALAALAVPFAVLALWVKLSSPGPVLYRQLRVGRGGETFGLLKFRSMVANADQIGGYATQQDDPRITPVGRILRRTSLDELPQLINVLKGDMSLVGPRPDVPAQRENYTQEEWKLRHQVKPGITGLAQVNGRSNVTPEARKRFDLDYAANPGMLRDLSILLQTVGILGGRGSN
ncbi:sugar transferase [Hoeflea sp.]|uniref:sugar transferase n=1 Tax=Hoeflea sp. TaxID=1940281 RepID=UPI003A950EFE